MSAQPRQRVVVLISGRGSNMRALAEQGRRTDAPYSIVKVISDQPAAAGLQIAEGFGIEAEALNAKGRNRPAYDAALAALVEASAPSLLVLAGFMRILSPEFVDRFYGRILNIHPSLLPKFPGLHTHRRVLEAGEPEHGATVHFITAQLDGGPRIIQGRVAVHKGDGEESLAARVQVLEHQIYPLAVRWFCEGRLHFEAGKAWLDGQALSEPVNFEGDA